MYREYDTAFKRLNSLHTEYERLLSTKEDIFSMTQPQGISYKEKVKGGGINDSFNKYLEKKEELRLDERIEEITSLISARKVTIDRLKKELENSTELKDQIYYLKNIKKCKVSEIITEVGVSRSTYNRLIREIYNSLKSVAQNDTK